MALQPAPTLHANLTLACPFCGQQEPLPADAAAQHRQLRVRLMQVQQARAAVEAPLAMVETVRKHWLIALVPLVIMSAAQWIQALSAPAEMPLETLAFTAIVGSLGLGMIGGYFGMMRSYRALIVPRLCARPPLQPGLSARCRTCGGDLPGVRDAEVNCSYCGTRNLPNSSLSASVDQLLLAERQEFLQRSREAFRPEAYGLPMKAFYRWAAITTVVFSAVGIVLLYLMR